MASSMAAITMPRSIAFSRATASAICNSSSRLALTAMGLVSFVLGDAPVLAGCVPEIHGSAVARGHGCAFGFLAALQRLGDQLVGEHKLCFRHLLDRQQNVGLFAGRRVRAAHA